MSLARRRGSPQTRFQHPPRDRTSPVISAPQAMRAPRQTLRSQTGVVHHDVRHRRVPSGLGMPRAPAPPRRSRLSAEHGSGPCTDPYATEVLAAGGQRRLHSVVAVKPACRCCRGAGRPRLWAPHHLPLVVVRKSPRGLTKYSPESRRRHLSRSLQSGAGQTPARHPQVMAFSLKSLSRAHIINLDHYGGRH